LFVEINSVIVFVFIVKKLDKLYKDAPEMAIMKFDTLCQRSRTRQEYLGLPLEKETVK